MSLSRKSGTGLRRCDGERVIPAAATRSERVIPAAATRRERVIPAAATRLWAGIQVLLLAVLLAGCGFELRGNPQLGIKTLAVNSVGGSQVAAEMRRTLVTGPTHVVTDAKGADAQLRVLQETRDKSVATITATGTVYEFELHLVVRYELTVPGREIPVIAPTEATAKRLITYSASAPIAKEAEEQLLFTEMQQELAGRILRHVASAARREM
jgi:LPS-assembly lipoprotein